MPDAIGPSTDVAAEESVPERTIRYQGAIIRDRHILLIRQVVRSTGRIYWLLPGGGRKAGETPEDCVRREMAEETGLEVTVHEHLLDWPAPPEVVYQRLRTYRCEPAPGVPRPGHEPEVDAAGHTAIAEVRWFDLRGEAAWDPQMVADSYTYSQVQVFRRALGYLEEGGPTDRPPIRYQGAIIRDHHMLLIRAVAYATGNDFWMVPGGGLIAGETPEACVRREMAEETGLDVSVRELLLDWPGLPGEFYQRLQTYRCEPGPTEPRPGYEPEPDAAANYAMVEVRWFDLRDEAGWDARMVADPFTYLHMRAIRQALGYLKEGDFLAPKMTYVFKVASGCQIRADVYRPPGDGPFPAILWLHGGALIFGHRGGLHPEQLARFRYLGAGYVVVAADYRLAPEVKLEAIIEDLQDAYAWMRAQAGMLSIDPDRIGVVGHSAGGYLALMAGCCLVPRPRALVSYYGYGDIVGAWYSRPDPFYCREPAVSPDEAYGAVAGRVLTGTPDARLAERRFRFYLYCRQQGLWPQEVAGHDPVREPAWFDRFCPLRNVGPAYPPTLLIHGDQDTDVPVEQSVLMAEELARHGVPNELLVLEGRGHRFDGDDDALNDPAVAGVFDRVLDFLAGAL